MKWKMAIPLVSLPFLLLLVSFDKQPPDNENEAALKQKIESYKDAYNKHDASAVASFWTENAEYINPQTGETIKGRTALQELFQTIFKEKPDRKLDFTVNSISLPSNTQAVVTGLAKFQNVGNEPSETAFKITYEKTNDQWLMSKVREVDVESPPDQYEHLKELEWLIGEWEDKDEDVEININYSWDKYKNFIIQKFAGTIEGEPQVEGLQIIGWDQKKEQFHSWLFDSDGGFGEGIWTKKDKSWVVESTQTLADGREGSAINIYTPLTADSYSWESTGREIGGEILPDVGPVTIVRKKG